MIALMFKLCLQGAVFGFAGCRVRARGRVRDVLVHQRGDEVMVPANKEGCVSRGI